MNDDEKLARSFFVHQGFKRIDYEPEGGSKPPDFLLEGRIAVEVRRLNQHEPVTPPGARPRGLEEDAIPLWTNIRDLLPSFGPPRDVSWAVSVDFGRPVPKWDELKRALTQRLHAFQNDPAPRPIAIQLFPSLEIELIRVGGRHRHFFFMGAEGDDDSGGLVTAELVRNLRICIDEKTKKVAGIRSRYPEWWLVLVDRIHYGEPEPIRTPEHNWDKILALSPLDPALACELPQPS